MVPAVLRVGHTHIWKLSGNTSLILPRAEEIWKQVHLSQEGLPTGMDRALCILPLNREWFKAELPFNS